MPTSAVWFTTSTLFCLGSALIVMALRARFRPQFGPGYRLGEFFTGSGVMCEAVAWLLRGNVFGPPGALARGIAGVSMLLALAMTLVGALAFPLGVGLPLDLPIPLRWYVWLLPSAPRPDTNHDTTQDAIRPRR